MLALISVAVPFERIVGFDLPGLDAEFTALADLAESFEKKLFVDPAGRKEDGRIRKMPDASIETSGTRAFKTLFVQLR